MLRLIATIAAGAALLAGSAWIGPAAHAAPQSSQQSPQQSSQQSPPPLEATSPLQLPPAGTPSRKPHGGSGHAASPGTVMRGGDTVSLVAMLPWWRPDDSRPPGSDPGELESQVLTACDLWLGFPYASGEAQSLAARLWAAQNVNEIDLVSNRIQVVDPDELNEIDRTAPDKPASNSWWLSGLLAVVGGGLAAFSAVRYLVA